MSADYSAYLLAAAETSSYSKFNNTLNAIQASMNAIGDTTKMAFTSGLVIPTAQLTQIAATTNQALVWNVSTWGPATTAGSELDYVSSTSNASAVTATTEGTAATILTGTSLAYDATKKNIQFYCPKIVSAANTNQLTIVILRGSTVIGQHLFAAAGSNMHANMWVQDTPSAATFSYVVKAFVDASNMTPNAGSGAAGTLAPMFLRVTKA